ncbi:hypothetical protein [Bradyrhizobium sp. dw_78]|uniref:hypothetical protein n=1 Tax=Bradyrhizobium sp. dw_78 TaxID=2719793 RepID=UPI001BD4A5DB|nr:hypothetical protein [Bradyrhizobium sp. dw_78]
MRAVIVAAVAMVVPAMMPARTEAQTTLPEISVSPPSQPPKINDQLDHKGDGDGKSGTGGKDDENHALEQLNQKLKRKVDETNPVLNTPPLDARSPDTKTGVVNIPGVQQQYGKNFGNSVVPYRPAPPVYAPLGHH